MTRSLLQGNIDAAWHIEYTEGTADKTGPSGVVGWFNAFLPPRLLTPSHGGNPKARGYELWVLNKPRGFSTIHTFGGEIVAEKRELNGGGYSFGEKTAVILGKQNYSTSAIASSLAINPKEKHPGQSRSLDEAAV
ncbi:hypothetical protein DL95DRAFT_451043 [Leptodontidium sp. 2 PMI_412]|nr:hypothetical protein DL95DRAFT_451043 [Leptodontidium sp. 2 PMI_412]